MNDAGAEYLFRAIFGEFTRAIYPYIISTDGSQQFLSETIQAAVDSLPDEREKRILALRFGIADGKRRTLDEVKEEFGVTRERIRQIVARALRKLRHPSRSRYLWHFFIPFPEDIAFLQKAHQERDLFLEENTKLKKQIEIHGIPFLLLKSPQGSRQDSALLHDSLETVKRSFPDRVHSLHQLRNALSKSSVFTFTEFAELVENGELTNIRNVGVTLLELAQEVVRIGKDSIADG